MPHLANLSRSLVWGLLLSFIAIPAEAHKVQVAGDVGGTLHIEPNDAPRAGESALAWFGLTRKGGQVIPLSECNCKLSVYTSTSAPSSLPLLTPALKAVSAEQYQGVPGAEVQFPKPGAYQLQLSGTPTAGGNFKPFELKFQVTVATGTSAPTASPQAISSPHGSTPEPHQPDRSWQLPVIALSTVLGLGILWGVWWKRRK
ncbi:MAG: hypothetical protein M3O33_11090 [Cyanobacteriota bacterium]|nr:hypothetical protein [Cyanobacteriota bacterium]